MVAWISYAIVTGLVLTGLAFAAESFRGVRIRCGRWLWASALLGTLAVPVAFPLLLPSRPDAWAWIGPAEVAGVASPAGVPADADARSAGLSLDAILGGAWALASAALLGLLAVRARRLARARQEWPAAVIDGIPVRIADRPGPAVIGVLRPEIVVPRWLRDRPAPDRGLVLAHERAHVEARDPLLVCAAWVAAACVPWNPAVWLQVARLRSRMEEDCDRRVLRDRPWSEARRYGELVIDLGTRTPRTPRWAAAAAFAAGRPPLERRIRSMYDLYPPLSRIRRFLAVAGVLGLAGALVALPRPAGFGARSGELADEAVPPTPSEVPDARPVAVEPPSIEVPPPVEAPPSVGEDITERPTFTPYTVAPDLVNRTQVQAALQAAYPPLLRDAGIGGTARVWFFIDAEGTVQDTRIDQSSGHAAIDDAALEVASEMRFSPALNRDQPVPVWVAFPITFQVR